MNQTPFKASDLPAAPWPGAGEGSLGRALSHRSARCAAMVALLCLCAAAAPVPATKPSEPTVTAADLPRVPPTEPKDALKTFKVRPGFHLELAASEPRVVDPIAMCFDGDGRMFVIEMRDYSERREERLSRIRMLEDLDNDGTYEKATIFLDNLPWATALTCVNGGLLVGATPDILFARDTDGDGVADEKRVLFTGFASTQNRLNVQGLFNNFIWGLDNRIHGCSGLDGGMVSQALHPERPPIDVRGHGFVIDPRDWSMTSENGGGQYGLSFDPWGRLFTCANSSHCEVYMYDERYSRNNPDYALPAPRISIAADGPAAEVYRASPEEPWRVIRTRWRIAGLVPGPVEGGGRSAGYFTGATGLKIYRGDAFGADYVGDAFVGDAGGNLVHHKRIRPGPDGIEPVAARPDDEQKIEFVASTDNWFRPVDFANAPDGTLYIADMYRETIEHPWSIPPNIKQFLDLNSGNDRGRIYRIAPDGFHRPPMPRLNDAPIERLVAVLEHANGWHRETAARLLFERQDRSAAPLLRRLLETSPSPLGRLHALCALEGLGALGEADVQRGLDDPDEHVRQRALVLAEQWARDHGLSEALWKRIKSMGGDSSPKVRYQLAFTLGTLDRAGRGEALRDILLKGVESRWVRAAVLSALAEGAGEQFALVQDAPALRDSPQGRAFLGELAELIGAQHHDGDVRRVLAAATHSDNADLRISLAAGLASGLGRSGKAMRDLEGAGPLFEAAGAVAQDKSQPAALRARAIDLLGHDDLASAMRVAVPLLKSGPEAVRLAALQTLDRFTDEEIPRAILSAWPAMTSRLRTEAMAVLLKRPDRALAVLEAIKAGTISPGDVNANQARLLRGSPDPKLRALASAVLPDRLKQRAAVVESFQPALSLPGDAARGHVLYQKLCISCHRVGDEGHAVGPDLVTVKNSGAEKLLLSILDPNREVTASYVAYLVETKDGQSVLGIVSADTPTHLTLREAYGKETTFSRDRIKRMTSQGLSIMPEGLEQGLSQQDIADLLQFISTLQ